MCQKQKGWLGRSFSQIGFMNLGSLCLLIALLLLVCEMGLKIHTTFTLAACYNLRFSVMSLNVHRLQALGLIAKIL